MGTVSNLNLDKEAMIRQLTENLAGANGERWLVEARKFLCGDPCWRGGNGREVKEPNLEFGSAFTVPARGDIFVALEHFVRRTDPAAPVKIDRISRSFRVWFLEEGGKIEPPAGEIRIACHGFKHFEEDNLIISELGGDERAETTLALVYFLLTRQPSGEEGLLCTNGWANIFRVRDRKGVIRTIHVVWEGDGWDVHAHPSSNSHQWRDLRRIFSRHDVCR